MSFTFTFGGNVQHAIETTANHVIDIDTWPGVINEIFEFVENNDLTSIYYSDNPIIDGIERFVFTHNLDGVIVVWENPS